jgi:uncharacterized membrane protein
MQKYTTEDLIQYMYRETTEDESVAIEKAMQTDYILREKFEALKESMVQLDSIKESPRQQSVMAILNYAKSSSAVEQL